MINYVCAYELVALFLIGLVIFFYYYKNHLPLYKNMFFLSIISILFLVVLFDLLNRINTAGVIVLSETVVFLLTLLSYLGVLVSSVLFWLYYLAQTNTLNFLKNKLSIFMFFPLILMMIEVIISVKDGRLFLVENGSLNYDENILKLFPLAIIFYIVAGSVVLCRAREKFEKKQYIFMQFANIIMICFIELYYVPERKLMLIYYCISAIIIMYYLLMHNVDKYIVSASGCFSMVGFKNVIEEKINYKKSFYCISVCISSMENMSNYCLEEEIKQVHAKVGEYLRDCGGRHNVYHIHRSEYMIMVKNESEANDLFIALRKRLPKTIRMNDKNISMYYKFYIVGNRCAMYSLAEFMRIIISMKKIVSEDSLDREIVVYNGKIRDRIEKELENIRGIKAMLEADKCELECMPIYDVKAEDINDIEINPVILIGERRLSIEEVWEVSREIGCSRDTNIMFLKRMLQFASEEKLFEKGIKHIRINMSGFHIISDAICEEYMSYIKEYNINPENIIFELIVNEDVPEDILAKSIKYFRDQGVHVFWDQFGINACNLKTIMEMPFDGVKINHTIVSKYCSEKSMQLIYLIRMFREKGWQVCLDGVRYPEGFDMVSKMDADYLQGSDMMSFVPEEKIREFLLKKGGILNDL